VVLVVEDDAALREVYRQALVAAGYRSVAVEDGFDALSRIELAPELPAVVVLDMALPRLDGRDVVRELRAQEGTRHIPILIVTGTDTRDLDAREFYGVLRKPIDPETLVNAVDDCLRARSFAV
jgi:CheY-like chemotaxis protein